MQKRYSSTPHHQRGVVLSVGLMILVVLTIPSVIAMTTSTLEERMSGASMDQNVAFQSAETALRDAELYIFQNLTSSSGFSTACSRGLCLPSVTSTSAWNNSTNWTSGTPITYGAFSGAANISGVTAQPKYIIELLPDLPAAAGNSLSSTLRSSSTGGGTAFRITALGWGKRPGTQSMLQSVYVKQ
jgi:type IV pilus assembly protein PilX